MLACSKSAKGQWEMLLSLSHKLGVQIYFQRLEHRIQLEASVHGQCCTVGGCQVYYMLKQGPVCCFQWISKIPPHNFLKTKITNSHLCKCNATVVAALVEAPITVILCRLMINDKAVGNGGGGY